MLVDRTFDDPRPVVNITFCNNDSILTLFDHDPDMIMLPVLKYTIIKNNVTRFRHKTICAFMIPDTGIPYGKFLPCDTSCKMTAFAFIRTYR